MEKFVTDCMVTVGTNLEYALQVADLLISADSRGHYRLYILRFGKNLLI